MFNIVMVRARDGGMVDPQEMVRLDSNWANMFSLPCIDCCLSRDDEEMTFYSTDGTCLKKLMSSVHAVRLTEAELMKRWI